MEKCGFSDHTIFFWLQSIELAKERVRLRVSEGGHYIDPDVIARRYVAGIRNLLALYQDIVDELYIFDNSEGRPELMAEKWSEDPLHIINLVKFTLLKDQV